MPRVRNARLDKLAEGIGECRDAINQATIDEKSFRSAALKEMQDKNIQVWSHAGVDFIRVPGEDKLKVKTHKDGGSETGAGDEPTRPADPGESFIGSAAAESNGHAGETADDPDYDPDLADDPDATDADTLND
jgi:hypothetical protein